jgi:hypothetical protein
VRLGGAASAPPAIAHTAWSIYTHKTEFDPARLTKPLT